MTPKRKDALRKTASLLKVAASGMTQSTERDIYEEAAGALIELLDALETEEAYGKALRLNTGGES